ncbi:oxidoreductase [Flavivirga aquimarina]|uniref:Oxidoreductase n=1 Tax=Flavivirga aquimarina TaxID=2027862 RepID=A0ABT8W9G1_9FLAO|nr:oxidoreductase [Flavivirga aquimarina]MDO5969713.1 oxidoreductase [Flavivirga aquimarina]
MNRIVLLLILNILVLLNCKSKERFKPRNISEVEIQTFLKDSMLNVRALEVNEGWVSVISSAGVGYTLSLNKNDAVFRPKMLDSLNYRSCAFQNNTFFYLSIGNPVKLYKAGTLVYEEIHAKAFYDSMDFWNDQEGIAIGDPTDDCMSIIITRDGGETWNKLSCDSLPSAKEGEAAFAASDTNIAIVGDRTWVATGGKSSRVLYSPDKGKTWEVYNTPIIQGLETTGMYSIDFYDELIGFAIGGDYTKPNDNVANKIKTVDGGKTWELVAQNENPGYRSCVQYIPNRAGKELIAIGFKGIDYSNDSGNSWKHLSDEGFYTIRFLNDSIAYASGAGRVSKLTFRE